MTGNFDWRLILFLSTVVFFTACSSTNDDGPEDRDGTVQITPEQPQAERLLPHLPHYRTIEGQTITDFVGTLAEGGALLAGHPELASGISVVDGIVGCYQDVGAVRARVYSNEQTPLSAGAVAIGDRNELLDPVNLFACVAIPLLQRRTTVQSVEYKPCTHHYTLELDGNLFYVIYAGTTTDICREFCAGLAGCNLNP
ncbi:hypothetical protein KFU94_62160 [Chloroflexi bacterium TSY]|nr:hypothetical protein [Chloroflexi bacterium TSY]